VAVRLLVRMIGLVAGEGMPVRRSKRLDLWRRICAEERGVATLGGAKFVWDLVVRVERE
jgi:hypothetical protein